MNAGKCNLPSSHIFKADVLWFSIESWHLQSTCCIDGASQIRSNPMFTSNEELPDAQSVWFCKLLLFTTLSMLLGNSLWCIDHGWDGLPFPFLMISAIWSRKHLVLESSDGDENQ
jgi:hypothetical protein